MFVMLSPYSLNPHHPCQDSLVLQMKLEMRKARGPFQGNKVISTEPYFFTNFCLTLKLLIFSLNHAASQPGWKGFFSTVRKAYVCF